MTKRLPLRHRVVDLVVDILIPFGRWFVPVMLGVGGFTLTDEARAVLAKFAWNENGWKILGWTLLGLGGLASIPAGLADAWRNKKVTDLEDSLSSTEDRVAEADAEMEKWVHQLRDLVSGVLYDMCRELGFGETEKNLDRLTIYAHEIDADGKGQFVPFGRVSFNPEFNKRARHFYPDDQGFIAQAWLHGEVYEGAFPDFQANPDIYYHKCAALGMPATVVDNIRMKSRFYYGKRIQDELGRKQLAVILLESRTPNRYTKEELRQFFGKHERTLSQLVQRIAPILPGTASGAGY